MNSPQRTSRRGALAITLVWVLVAGEVNRVPVLFLVDTGASAVSVSDAQARQAQLPKGRTVTLRTANGERQGEMVLRPRLN